MKFAIFLDLFQSPLSLYFSGSDRRGSIIGFVFSLMIYIYLLFSFVTSDLFIKNSPIAVIQSNQIPQSKKVSFNEKTLIAIAVTDTFNKRYIDETIFTIQFRYLNATNMVIKKMLPCTTNDVYYNKSLFHRYELENAYCLENKSFDLEGYWDESHLNYVAVNIYECNNVSSNGKCKSPEFIQAFFRDPRAPKYLSLLYQDSQINLYDYQSPFIINYRVDFQAIDPYMKKSTTIFLKNANVDTDDGVIFPNDNLEYNHMFHSKTQDFMMRTNTTEPYVQFLMYAAKEEVTCTRRYQKLPEILGSLYGMMQLLMLFLQCIPYLMMYVSTMEEFLNSLYSFPQEAKNHAENTKFGKSGFITPMQKNMKEKNLDAITKEQPSSNKALKFSQIKSFMRASRLKFKAIFEDESQKNMIHINWLEFLIYLLKKLFHLKKTQKQMIIYKAEQAFSRDLDIVNLIRKIHDFDKLRLMLLNPEQITLFNNISKPLIEYDTRNNPTTQLKMSKFSPLFPNFEEHSKSIKIEQQLT